MTRDELNLEQPLALAVERPVGPGIMVISSSAKVQYTNEAARHFLTRLNQEKRRRARDGALPVALEQLIDKVRQALECRPVDKNPGQLEATQVVVAQDQPVLLEAFGLSDRFGLHRSRIVITMQEISASVAAKHRAAVPPSA